MKAGGPGVKSLYESRTATEAAHALAMYYTYFKELGGKAVCEDKNAKTRRVELKQLEGTTLGTWRSRIWS
jgi:hypothetical protein